MDKKTIFEVKNIDFCYGKTRAIDNLSLTIEQGKFYGIVGPNGCGKTTLLDLMTGNKPPESGTITYLGQKIKGYARRKTAKEIALVPQDLF